MAIETTDTGDDEMQIATWGDVKSAIAASPKASEMGFAVAEVVDPMRAGSRFPTLVFNGRVSHTNPCIALKIIAKNS